MYACSAPGVIRASVNLLGETADVEFDAARTAVDAIAEAIEDLGFEAKLQVAVSRAAATLDPLLASHWCAYQCGSGYEARDHSHWSSLNTAQNR